MNTTEFLGLLVPHDGYTFTATPATGLGWINTPHTSVGSMVVATDQLEAEKRNAYFALASFNKEKVWDGVAEKWRSRVQSNAKSLKALWLDLDVEAGNPKKFDSKRDALHELQGFCKLIGLPRPMLVDSGGGIHVYWPLTEPVPAAKWKPVAVLLKAITQQLELLCDQAVTADEARVLRMLGSTNNRRGSRVTLISPAPRTYTLDELHGILTAFGEQNAVATPAVPRTATGQAIAGVPQASSIDDNLGATNDPLHFDRIAFHCGQIGLQAGSRGASASEPLWHCAIGIAKFCEPQTPAAEAVSDGHPNYSPDATRRKLDNWPAGPTTCAKFRVENAAICSACPHDGQITSPAQLGRAIREAAAPIVTVATSPGIVTSVVIPEPPSPYKRRANGGVVIESEDKDGNPTFIKVFPHDFYPIKIMRQYGHDATVDERSLWRMHLPRLGATDVDLPQSLISDSKRLHAVLLAKGAYITPDESKATQQYMSAYLQTLAAQADREKLYERLGWHDDRKAFVLGTVVQHADGTVHAHEPGRTVLAVTKGGVHPEGTLAAWQKAMQFYNRPGMEGHRMFVYAALAAPIFHMTGHKGVLMTASGESGRGKTTCLKACASIWGDPEDLVLNGNKDGSTTNALYEHLGTYNSLPFLLDDTTERDPEEIRRMMLNLSQGMGKERMKGSEHSMHSVRWETIVQSTANTDDINRIMSGSKDVEPHLMRFISVEFGVIDSGAEAKIQADKFLRDLHLNYGLAGPAFMAVVVTQYDAVKKIVEKNMDMITRLVNSANSSAERLWLATVAAAYSAAQIAAKLKLLDFPYKADLEWMVRHLSIQRDSIRESKSTPQELLSNFLEQNFGAALVLSAKVANNLDNVSHRPTGKLLIRHELDFGHMYVSRTAIADYCATNKIPFRKLEQQLMDEGVVIHHSKQKVLGADTIYAKGQSRCWLIDASKLSGALSLAEQAIQQQKAQDMAKKAAGARAPALPPNVIPIGVRAA